ncbi:hypothetical protein RJ640_011573 [Escallonia rubra]|uniref:Retrovirus-related Pol polyprotein from transposon RE1 n=1 Tax=Escallonia rubra TaxID=112253 RepID=A0AA88R579_9ASTE|nr:hypothetical protein RJ640_011573 [Escallonia rubra]
MQGGELEISGNTKKDVDPQSPVAAQSFKILKTQFPQPGTKPKFPAGVGGLPTHGNSESSILPITGHKLNGLNYLQWSQSVFMFISGKGKEDYLTGTIETPSKDDPSYKKWDSENHMVMSWLINTMNLEIGQNFMFYGTAKEIWENVKETYSDNENTSELFEIKGFYIICNKGENSATIKDEYQFWHLYNESTDSFPLISHINLENNTESSSQEDKSPPNFHAQNTGKWKNLVYSRKPRDNEVEHPILPEPYQDPNPSTVPAESDGKRTILIVYVDDIILTGDDYEEMNRLKIILTKEFEIKDLGKLKYFLGMEVARSNKGISISQRKYTLDLLKETGMLGCKPVDTPMDPICKLGRKEGSSTVDKGRYQRLVGRLIYLSHTRPDIGFSVSVVSQFMNDPTEEHLDAVYRILRYLKMTPGKGLFFKKGYRKNIDIYCDADWAGSITDRRSTSGYCTYVWGNLVTWRSKKQSVMSRSSAEAEFRAIALSICEGMWLKRLLEELKITCEGSIKVFCDNQASINIAKNPVHHDRTKNVEIDRHFIREKIEGGIIEMVYTPSSHQTADILTKALPKGNFDNLNSKLGMINIYSQLEGE